jgi:acetoin utilization protein AcuB
MTTINDIMSRDVVCVSPDTALMEIRRNLHERGFHHLLVRDEDEQLVGVISDRDVLKAVSPFLNTYSESARDVRSLERPASEIMREEPVTVTPDTSVSDAAGTLLEHKISCLPVLDGSDLVGIVTTKDLLRHFAGQETAS